MPSPSEKAVTELLADLRGGDRSAINRLLPLIYDELHRLARHQRLDWHGDYTLNTTALVHEAYLKLVDQEDATWQSRAHFLAVAGQAMRHILIDYAKRRRALKRGGDQQPLSLDDVVVMSEQRAEEIVALGEALDRLARIDERQNHIVDCRFFAGMTIEETAAVLDVSTATVKRGWRMARAWLYRELQRDLAPR